MFSFGVARKCNRFTIHSLATIMMISLLWLGVRFKNSSGKERVRISGDRTFRHTSTLLQQPLYFGRLLQLFSHCLVIVIYSIMGGFSIAHFLVTLFQMRGGIKLSTPLVFFALALLLYRFSIDLLHWFVSFCETKLN